MISTEMLTVGVPPARIVCLGTEDCWRNIPRGVEKVTEIGRWNSVEACSSVPAHIVLVTPAVTHPLESL